MSILGPGAPSRYSWVKCLCRGLCRCQLHQSSSSTVMSMLFLAAALLAGGGVKVCWAGASAGGQLHRLGRPPWGRAVRAALS